MRTELKMALRIVAVTVVLGGLVFLGTPPQAMLKRLYLWHANIAGPVSWSDACVARRTIQSNEPAGRCTRMGTERIGGRTIMYVFSDSYIYELEKAPSGEWKLKHKVSAAH
jgi:hypothetical protein